MDYWTRDDLIENYETILRKGLTEEQVKSYKETQNFGPGIVPQKTSGSSGGECLIIPRYIEDIQDVYARTLRVYLRCYQKPPERIALLGGVSHFQAAMKFKIRGTEFVSFSLSEKQKVIEYDPVVLSCYPSVIREIVADKSYHLSSLKCIKVGGEPFFQADLDKIKERFPGIIVVEQYGSTEMPGMGFGLYDNYQKNGIELEYDRYDFSFSQETEWKSIYVKDKFPKQAFPLGKFLNMGDEVIFDSKERLLKIRRVRDPINDYLALAESLLSEKIYQLQMNLDNKIIFYQGQALPGTWVFRDETFKCIHREGVRLKESNKLPFLTKASL